MRCDDVHAHLADYLAETLRADLADQVRGHLETCRICLAEVEALDETWDLLGTLRAEPPDVVAMRKRFTATLDGYCAGLASQHTDRPAQRGIPEAWPARLRWMAAAAILVIGIAIGRAMPQAPIASPELDALRGELGQTRELVALSLLQLASPSDRLKGVTWTNRQPGNEVATVLLDTLMNDPSVNVRLAAIDALKRFGDRVAIRRGALDALSRQSSPLVQIAVIDFAAEINGAQAADSLRRLSADPTVSEIVRARAAAVLQRIL